MATPVSDRTGREGDRPDERAHSADNVVYDLISIQYHALKGAEVCDRYIEDAHDHTDVIEFIQQVRDQDNQRAERAHQLLRELTKARDGIG